MNKRCSFLVGLVGILACTIAFPFLLHADSPPENTIPVISWAHGYEDIDTELYCRLSWWFFDGLAVEYFNESDILEHVVLPADTTGMYTVINPWNITCMTHRYSHMFPMNSTKAFAWPVWKGYTIDGTTYTQDALRDSMTAVVCRDSMEVIAGWLEEFFNEDSRSVWFYFGYDEAPANQWNRMVSDSSAYDNYMPNLFTQAYDTLYRPDLGDTVIQPRLTQVDSLGVLSWMRWHISQADPTREQSFVISAMQTINDWAWYSNTGSLLEYYPPPNFETQADVVRGIFGMEYQAYNDSGPVQPFPEPNHPSFIIYDPYPYRLVGIGYQNSHSYTQQLGDSLEAWLLDNFEEGMDSAFVTAWNIGLNEEKDISVFLAPQVFGRAGGVGMWDTIPDPPVLSYSSFNYRIPTPQEFRLQCNSGLLRQARAIIPYCLSSYTNDVDGAIAGLLDENRIPFNAPFEEWAYRDRPVDDFAVFPPDSIPPFMSGYDPLYSLPARPDEVAGSERNRENYLLWKFAPYARLWNSVRGTLGAIARVAPELSRLSWWEGREDNASIEYDAALLPLLFRTPQIKVFTDASGDCCFLFYLNRFCRANGNPFEITVDAGDFPSGTPFSEYALDHSRRFLIEGRMIARDVYAFRDTLDAGEARLIQVFDDSEGLDADVRITDPDVNAILPARNDTLVDSGSVPGESVDIVARFYNMGTEPRSNVRVFLLDETSGDTLDVDVLSFGGLSTSSCYTPDMEEASFTWTPDSTDIGVHVLRVSAQTWPGEPDPSDNTATLVHLIDPRDYATEVLGNPWDMTEATGHLWHTDDIVETLGWNDSAFTDSISGMFEGVLTDPSAYDALVLYTGSGSGDWIDSGLYRQFSLAGRADGQLSIRVYWEDSHGDTSYVDTGESLSQTWREIGPVALDEIIGSSWGDDPVRKFWIGFGGGNIPRSVRMGWVTLTE